MHKNDRKKLTDNCIEKKEKSSGTPLDQKKIAMLRRNEKSTLNDMKHSEGVEGVVT